MDDSKTTQNILKWTFKKEGCDVETANDGQEALEMMQSTMFCLVVMDILMPNMDGVTSVTRLREFEASTHRTIQPVILSAEIEFEPSVIILVETKKFF